MKKKVDEILNPSEDYFEGGVSNYYESVNHPKHYLGKSGLEVNDVIEEFGLGRGFRLGSSVKYILRAGKKPGEDAVKDLKKAIKFLEEEIKYIEKY